MSTQVKLRRGTSLEHETFTGASAELTVDTTNTELRLHDGVTPGGIRMPRTGTDFDQIPINANIVYPVATIADLRNLEPVFDGQQCELLGHTVAGVGGGMFYADYSSSAADDNGAVVVTVGGQRWVRKHSGQVSVDWYGAVPFDVLSAENNYTAFRSALAFCLTHDPVRLECQFELIIGVGEYFISGNSPFCFNRTELLSMPGGYRYRRGFKISGSGRRSSIITLVTKNSGDYWMYDTLDENFPTDNAVMDYVQFDGITFRGTDSRVTQSVGSKTSGFRMVTAGWEKYFTFTNCEFTNLDTAIHFSGYGNADHNRFYGCHFNTIRDEVFYINNNQAVANTLIGCDMEEITGFCFHIGPEGGGDITYISGSIILYPQLNDNGDPLVAQNTKGFVFWDNSGKNTGASSGPGQHKFRVKGLRFETYSETVPLVFSYRNTQDTYGSLDVLFEDCSIVQPFEYGQWTIASNQIGVLLENRVDVRFLRCDISEGYTFTVAEDDGTISFEDCRYYPLLPISNTELLAGQCSLGGGVTGSIKCRGLSVLSTLVNEGAYNQVIVPDFTIGRSAFSSEAFRQIKHPLSLWPQTAVSGPLKFYLPAGSCLLSCAISKPADAVSSPVSNHVLELKGAGGETLLNTGTGDINRAINKQQYLTDPYIVPAAPNNYIELVAGGDGGSSALSPSGSIMVRYI